MAKLAIFDLDGTLCHTITDIYNSLSATFNNNSVPVPTLTNVQTFMGDGLTAFLNKAYQTYCHSDCPPQVIKEFIKTYSDKCTETTTLYAGIPSLLNKLKVAGISLAVLSNKSELLVHKIIDHFGLTDVFDIISGGDTFIEKKPSPLPINETLRITNFNYKDAIMIGDSYNDICAGAAANVATYWCSYGYGSLPSISPNYIINNPKEIYHYIMEQR